MSTKACIKQGDTGRILEDTLYYDGSPLNLTGASVQIVFKHIETASYFERNASLYDAPNGVVRYTLQALDFDVAGLYNVEWKVTLGGGTIIRVPDDRYLELRVIEHLSQSVYGS